MPGVTAVSAVSLICGASLGPEEALDVMGDGSWLARRRGLGTEDSQLNTLAGFAGAYGGLFSSTVIEVLLILEVARPGGQRLGLVNMPERAFWMAGPLISGATLAT